MNINKLKVGDEVWFPEDFLRKKVAGKIGKLVHVDSDPATSMSYGFDFGSGFDGTGLRDNVDGFRLTTDTGWWLFKADFPKAYRVYSGEKLSKLKVGDEVQVVGDRDARKIGHVFIVQYGIGRSRPEYRLIRLSKTKKAKRENGAEPEAENILGNLLATLHRDGGQHVDSVGLLQAAKDAEEKWVSLMMRYEEAEAKLAAFIPQWKDAPEWAKFLAMDCQGAWFYYTHRPSAGVGTWTSPHGQMVAANFPDWKETLEERPK